MYLYVLQALVSSYTYHTHPPPCVWGSGQPIKFNENEK